MNIDEEINDIRTIQDFKQYSFSKFKKSEVKKELLKNLSSEKLEHIIYWTAELICAGHFIDIWEIILLFVSKYIHLANPKLPIYINKRFQSFKEIISMGYIGNELSLRNNINIRKLFFEIMIILCFSKKNHSFEQIKMNIDEDFDMIQLSNKLKAPKLTYATDFMLSGDPKELFIAINEFVYNLENKNSRKCCYWVEWLIEFDNICKRKKENSKCERRDFIPVDSKFQMDNIWILWDILLQKCDNNQNSNKIIMQNLLNLFCIKYTTPVIKKRRYIIYYAINLLTENINFDIDIVHDKKYVEQVLNRSLNIFKQIKKNEESPGVDYLFNNVNTKQKNLEKSIQRIELINKFENSK
jgi:hypothetical protein